jgi:hypothetical protein
VNYDKLDADLSAELGGAVSDTDTLPIFIQTERSPVPDEQSFLKQLGVSGETEGRDLFTADLSRRAIDELSHQPWVRYLKLSRKLGPLSGE